MTREVRTYVDIRDISAVEFCCPRCQTEIVIRLDNGREADALPARCPACRTEIFKGDGPGEVALRAFMDFIHHFPRTDLTKAIRLQLRSEPEK